MTNLRTDDAVPHHEGVPDSAPALNPPTWSGRKTAIAAALAIGFSSVGAAAAAAALPAGSAQGDGQVQQGGLGPGGFGPGGRQPGSLTHQGTQEDLQQAPQQGTQQDLQGPQGRISPEPRSTSSGASTT